MEIRVLQYFLAVAREQSISGAAEFLHLTQPTLSRQLKELEESLGTQLFIRGNRKITLTEDGMYLRKRAEEIVELVQKTEREITFSDEIVTGDINIGTGETDAIRLIIKTFQQLNATYPQIHYHITSGDSRDVLEQLDKGLIDFGIVIGQVDISKYDYLTFPIHDTWGVLMRKEDPLSENPTISPSDLWDKPLILSRQIIDSSDLIKWMGQKLSSLNIIATYNLVYNASIMVDEGLGYALCLDKLINTTGDSSLCFRPFHPQLEVGLHIIWKKYQIFSKASNKFLEVLQKELTPQK